MFFVLYLIAFIYCANLGVNATFLLVYLYQYFGKFLPKN